MKQQLYIAGGFCDATDGRTFEVSNPSTQQGFAQVADAGLGDLERAVGAAAQAFPQWSGLGPSERAACLLRAAQVAEKRKPDLIKALVEEAGSWIGKASYEADTVVKFLRYAATTPYQVTGQTLPSDLDRMSLVVRKPLGAIAVISPWNFPALLSTRGIATALAVGNTIVLKPAEDTPYSGGGFFAEVFAEAGVPAGAFNVLSCSRQNVAALGEALIADRRIRGVSFTGSTGVGRVIGRLAGEHFKKCCLELGGKDALLVLDDADLKQAVHAATFGAFMHHGQICMATKRILVHADVAEEFTRRFAANVARLRAGDPTDPGKVIGPVINARQLARITEHLQDAVEKGAEVRTGGTHQGLFHEATVLAGVNADMRIYHEETFGPVVPVITIASDEEAIAIANESDYGLSAGIITRDQWRGVHIAERLQTGMAHINDSSVNDEPWIPFGGVKHSGVGRHGGIQSIEAFTETRWITVPRTARKYPPPFMGEGS